MSHAKTQRRKDLARYMDFLQGKVPRAQEMGFEPRTEVHESLMPHQRDIALWAVRGGRRAIFASFGLGKTRIHLQLAKWVIEKTGGKFLIVAPLGVRQEFTRNDGPAMGMEVHYVRTTEEAMESPCQVLITNYERVRDGGIDVSMFAGAGLDESSVLRSFGSKTYHAFLSMFDAVPYRYVFTATPSPNRYKELIHYGGFLGIMDTGQALTRFFQRDSEQANNLTLYPHMEEQFWRWLASWACFIQRPSDLGYSDEGYDLPPIKVHWHRVQVDHTAAWGQIDSWGQSQLFLDQSSGLKEQADVKRQTAELRLSAAMDIIQAEGPEDHWLLWHDLELERKLIEKRAKEDQLDLRTVYGSQDLEAREDLILGFGSGEYRILATKPVLAGSGCNLQRHCHKAIFLGSTHKFNDFIQAIHRIQRFQQPEPVEIHIVHTESEDPVIENLKKKWRNHDRLVAKMTDLIRENGLNVLEDDMELKRTLGSDRDVVESERFRCVNNDCVAELMHWPDDSVDQIVTSIPFGNQYEYSPSYNDFGHNPDNQAFFEQMDFLVPELLRVLKPGRVACIHVKDRIRFGNVTKLAMPTLDPFSDDTVRSFRKHGFAFMGRITIDTDVVRENNQTYRLGWSENAKDSTKMGCGVPEYVLLFRKLPSELDNAYADTPVTKDKGEYTRADWQIDASSLWRSSGNRLPDPEFLNHLTHEEIIRIWRGHCKRYGYDYREHVEIAKALEGKGKLPSSFMLFPPVAKHRDVWTDIARMRVLNSEQKRRNQENHVCPLQLDIVERLIRRFSNKGEIVFDPFGGIGTVPYMALKMERHGWMTELNQEYWRCAVGYCEQAEAQAIMPTLFDVWEKDESHAKTQTNEVELEVCHG